jgi:hypothetical protein
MSMSIQRERTSSAAIALDHVRRELVAISASLAEHGPTEPREAAMWARDEINKVVAYIRAVEKVEQAVTD